MTYQIILTASQEAGLLVKLQEENTKRLRPILINGIPTKQDQLTVDQFAQWIIESVAEQGVLQLKQLEEAQLVQRVKIAMADPIAAAQLATLLEK